MNPAMHVPPRVPLPPMPFGESKGSGREGEAGKMPVTAPIELKRHALDLSPEEAEEIVGAVADLLVNYLKKQGNPAATGPTQERPAHA